VTHPDIVFVVSIVSQFLNSPYQDHWDVVLGILKYIKKAQEKDLLMKIREMLKLFGILTLIGQGNQAIDAPVQGIVFLLEVI